MCGTVKTQNLKTKYYKIKRKEDWFEGKTVLLRNRRLLELEELELRFGQYGYFWYDSVDVNHHYVIDRVA